ncbi:hypothetical protein PIROE2DRAFT_15784 [Piromyces sp. E2]|nr:hypothetical protein PIROE2DRAFT_15784 [Piromyces sp. E2]|eukprot:OUM58855.1 hypothetical protein PIROE2DRAFT_15784 [Piromyces sp. E2]
MSRNEVNQSKTLVEKKRKHRVLDIDYVDVIDPKFDVAFWRLFLNEKEMMIHFLNSILNLQDKIEEKRQRRRKR